MHASLSFSGLKNTFKHMFAYSLFVYFELLHGKHGKPGALLSR